MDIYRSNSNKIVAGVCGGFGETIGIDPTWIRFITILLFLITGIFPVLIIYLTWACVTPLKEPPSENLTYKRLYRSKERVIFGVCASLGQFFGLNVPLVRLIYCIFFLLSALIPLGIAYLLLAFLIPPRPPSEEVEINLENVGS